VLVQQAVPSLKPGEHRRLKISWARSSTARPPPSCRKWRARWKASSCRG